MKPGHAGPLVLLAAVLGFAWLLLPSERPPEPEPAPLDVESPIPVEGTPSLRGVREDGRVVFPRGTGGSGIVVVLVRTLEDVPIPEARVLLLDSARIERLGEGRTNAAGEIVFERVRDVDVRAVAWHRGHVPEWGEDAPGPDGSARIVIRLEPGVPCSGRVVADRDGSPIADATVWALTGRVGRLPDLVELNWDLDETRTGPDGSFDFTGLPLEGPVTLVARARGHGTALKVLETRDGAADTTIRLPAHAGIVGLVRAPDGSPCADARVTVASARDAAFAEDPDDAPPEFRTRTDEKGWYRIAGVSRETRVRVLAEGCRGSRGGSAETVVRGDDPTRIDVRLEPRGGLVVRVVRSDGAERKDSARIWLLGAAPSFLNPKSRHAWAETLDPGASFRYEGLEPGEYELHAELEESVPVRTRATVVAGEAVEVEVRGVPGPSLVGTVVDSAGKPVAGADVVFRILATDDVAGRTHTTRTREDGSFEIPNVQDVQGLLDAISPRHLASRTEAWPGREPIRIALATKPLVRARLLRTDGVLLPTSVTWTAHPVIMRSLVARDGTTEAYASEALVNSVFRLSGDGLGPVLVGPVSAEVGSETDLGDLDVSDGGALRGRVTNSRGAPVSGASVRLLPLGPAATANVGATLVADEEGRFTGWKVLGSPSVQVRIQAHGHVPKEVTWSAPREGLEVVLQVLASVRIRVFRAEGTRIEEGWIRLRGGALLQPWGERIGDILLGLHDGEAWQNSFLPGEYRATYHAEPKGPGVDIGTILVASEDDKTVDLTLP